MAPLLERNNVKKRVKFGQLLNGSSEDEHEDVNTNNSSSGSSPRVSFYTDENPSSPYYSSSPWGHAISPYINSPWIKLSPLPDPTPDHQRSNVYYTRGRNCLIGSLLREEGHVYSMAVKSGTLYTGSESKNIRVWKKFQDAGGFKSGSGLVKAIVVSKDKRVFTGHQDGKIRIWSEKGKRVGTLPKLGELLKNAINPRNYIEVRRHHKVPKVKHFDAVSSLTLNEEAGLLYSGSWDKTIKVWRISDGKCIESIEAHDDAINSIVVGFGGLVFSGSADGTVKVWRRELDGKSTKHFCVTTLLNQENAVTSLAVAGEKGGSNEVLYCGSSDGLVNFWEREKDEVVYGGVLRGHKLAVLCLATAGRLVMSGSADKTICVWRRERGGAGVHSCLAVLSGHSGPVKCLAVEQDHENYYNDDYDDDENDDGYDDTYDEEDDQGKDWIVYSGSLDNSVRIWRVSEHAPDKAT